jgi:hypothetical protein
VSLFARRFAPARGVTLDPGALVLWRDGRLVQADGCFRLMRRGGLNRVKAS